MALLTSAILGSLTGLIGSITNTYFNYKLKKLEYKHKEQEYQFQLEYVKITGDIAFKNLQQKEKIEEAKYDGKAYVESIKASSKSSFPNEIIDRLLSVKGILKYPSTLIAFLLTVLFGFLEFFKGLMRPGITAYQAVIETWIVWQAWVVLSKAQNVITPDLAKSIILTTIDVVMYLTVSTFTWWFGDRKLEKYLWKLLELKK